MGFLYPLADQTMYDMLGWLAQEEGIRLEPSALAGYGRTSARVCISKLPTDARFQRRTTA